MKITQNHYDRLKDALLPLLQKHKEVWEAYKNSGLTKTRFCWDLLSVGKINLNFLYDYLNDDNIASALKKICDPYLKD